MIYTLCVGYAGADVSLVIWAALGGSGADNEALRKMAAQRRYRVEFADNAARWLQQYGYDGLVLHWRQPIAGQDRGMLSALVRTLKRRLAEDALRLGIVLPADKERRTAGYDVREVAQVSRRSKAERWYSERKEIH